MNPDFDTNNTQSDDANTAFNANNDNLLLVVKSMLKVKEKGGTRFELRVPSLQIKHGEFLGVVGDSGCGKSTLLDLLGLVLRPDHSDIFSLHTPVLPLAEKNKQEWVDLRNKKEVFWSQIRKKDIGYVLQSGGLLPYLSVKENILLPALLNKLSLKTAETRCFELAKYLGILDQLDKKPAYLSGGQRQRVAIARSLIHLPTLVLADEPTAAVDRFIACEIRDIFRTITAQNSISVVMVTHDRELIKDYVDTCVTFKIERVSPTHTISTLVSL